MNHGPTIDPKPASIPAVPSWSSHFVAGLSSGLVSSVLLQPADLLKTRLQQSPSSSLLPVLRSLASSDRPVASLWRGTLPSALRTGLGAALYFSSLNCFRQRLATTASCRANLRPHHARDQPGTRLENRPSPSSVLPQLTPTENLVAGAAARLWAGVLMMPITVIKVRYESDLYSYGSLFAAGRDILSRQGVGGFFTGVGATALRDAPYAGLYVLLYEAGKVQLTHTHPSASHHHHLPAAVVNFTSAVLAAALATTATNPFDAVKTRVQLLPARYGNMVRATAMMWRHEGLRSFFDGLGLRMGRKALSSAFTWMIYEETVGRARS